MPPHRPAASTSAPQRADGAAGLGTPQRLLDAPGYLARRLYQAYVAIWTRRVDSTMTGPQFAVLLAVREQPDSDQGTLAGSVALDSSTMADVARRLQERGLLARVPHPSDARRKLLRLTPAGEAELEAVEGRARDLDALLLEGLEGPTGRDLLHQLEALSAHWVALADTGGRDESDHDGPGLPRQG